MKFSVISTLFMAAVPALATDYVMTCDRKMYNPKDTAKTEFQYWTDVYHNLCQNLWSCQSSEFYALLHRLDTTALGRCNQCPSDLPATYMNNQVTLDKII